MAYSEYQQQSSLKEELYRESPAQAMQPYWWAVFRRFLGPGMAPP